MQALRLLHRGRGAGPLQHLHRAAPAHPAVAGSQFRCMASGSKGQSWSELLSSAADLGKAVAGKVGDTLKSAVTSIIPSGSQDREPDRAPSRSSSTGSHTRPAQVVEEESLDSQLRTLTRDAFGGGLVGRMLGGVMSRTLGGALRGIEEQMQATRALQQEAATAIKRDDEVRRRLGGAVEVQDPYAQESSTTSINGFVQQQVVLRMPVVGPRGMAEAVVEQRGDDMRISVQLPDGRQLDVSPSGGGSGVGGRVIDVDWTEVR